MPFKNRAFTLQTLLLTLTLMAAVEVLAQVQSAAYAQSVLAQQTTAAALLLQTETAAFTAQTPPYDELCSSGQSSEYTACYQADGAPGKAGDAAYTVTVRLTPQKRPAGVLVTAEFTVTNAAGAPLATLQSQHYKSDYSGNFIQNQQAGEVTP